MESFCPLLMTLSSMVSTAARLIILQRMMPSSIFSYMSLPVSWIQISTLYLGYLQYLPTLRGRRWATSLSLPRLVLIQSLKATCSSLSTMCWAPI